MGDSSGSSAVWVFMSQVRRNRETGGREPTATQEGSIHQRYSQFTVFATKKRRGVQDSAKVFCPPRKEATRPATAECRAWHAPQLVRECHVGIRVVRAICLSRAHMSYLPGPARLFPRRRSSVQHFDSHAEIAYVHMPRVK